MRPSRVLPAALLGLFLVSGSVWAEDIDKPPTPPADPKDQQVLHGIRTLSHENAAMRAQAALQFVNQPDPRAFEHLLRLIDVNREADEDVRLNAVRALGEIGNPEAYRPLLKVLGSDPRETVQWVAIISIGKIQAPESFERLAAILADPPKPEWKHLAAYALGHTGDDRALRLLDEAFSDPDRRVRRDAARALAALADPSGCKVLLAHITNEPKQESMRAMADALVKLNCLDALPVFEQLKEKLDSKQGEFLKIDTYLDESAAEIRRANDLPEPGSEEAPAPKDSSAPKA